MESFRNPGDKLRTPAYQSRYQWRGTPRCKKNPSSCQMRPAGEELPKKSARRSLSRDHVEFASRQLEELVDWLWIKIWRHWPSTLSVFRHWNAIELLTRDHWPLTLGMLYLLKNAIGCECTRRASASMFASEACRSMVSHDKNVYIRVKFSCYTVTSVKWPQMTEKVLPSNFVTEYPDWGVHLRRIQMLRSPRPQNSPLTLESSVLLNS